MGLWRVLSDLEEDGYRTEWGLFSAEETGAPHQRIRCFILAKLPHACGKGLQGDEFGGTRSPQVEGIQGTHEPTSELHQVRHQQFPNSGNAKGYSTIEGCIRQSLGNPTGERPRGGSENREGEQSEVLGAGSQSDAELAHPASAGKHGELRDFKQEKSRSNEYDCNGETTWPARPGEEQYEWEEPRVVADRKVKRCGGRKDKDGENREGLSEQEGEERSILRSKTEGCSGDGETTLNEAQSELGGAVDGTQHRVDRLRLLGNGVVPQTAELAWKTLWKKMN